MRNLTQILSVVFFLMFGDAALHAQTVELPPGWTAMTEPQNGVFRVRIAGSEDIVLIGLVASKDAAGMATALAIPSAPDLKIESHTPLTKLDNGILSITSTVRAASGSRVAMIVLAFPKADGTTALTMLTTSKFQDVEQMKARIKSLSEIMGQFIQGRTLTDFGKNTNASGPMVASQPGSPLLTVAANMPPMGDIASVYYDSQLMMVGCCLNTFLTTTVIFKDGRACECLEEWLEDSSLSTFQAKQFSKIGRWRKTMSGYAVIYPGEKEDAVPGSLIKPLPRGKRLNHAYANSEARGASMMSPGLSSGTLKTSGFLDLRPDGTFSRQSSQQYVMATPISQSWTGRYLIDGYAIQLDYGDGTREIKSLLTFADGDDAIVFDDMIYGKCMVFEHGKTSFNNCRDGA
jgi:hypothetical protein